MRIEAFLLCDAATDQGGKLNLLGTFDTIWAPVMPFVYPQYAVALRIRFSRIEEGMHKFKITVMNQDGKSILPPLDTEAVVQFPPDGPSSIAPNMILNAQGVKFETYGEYSIDLAVDSRHVASLPLFLKKPPLPPEIPGQDNPL